MNPQLTATGKKIIVVGAIMGWLTLLAQLVLILMNRRYSVPVTVIQFFSYFTILSNILVAMCFSFRSIGRDRSQFWQRADTQGAIAVYIMVVGIVYNVVLRFLWAPTGAQKMVDELLHLVMPLYYLSYWTFFAPKHGIQWRDATRWLVFPFFYLAYVLVRGAITNLYPYPFLDAYNQGYQKVLVSSLVILLLFLLLSLALIAAAKKLSAREQRELIAE